MLIRQHQMPWMATILGITVGVFITGCTQWQYPWRTFSGADKQPAASNQGEPLIPPTAMNDFENGSKPQDSTEPPKQMNDLLARLQGATGSPDDGSTDGGPLQQSSLAQQSSPRKSPAKRRAKPLPSAPVDSKSKARSANASKNAAAGIQPVAPARPVVLNVRVSQDAPPSIASNENVMTTPSTAQANQALRTPSPRHAGNSSNSVANRIQSETSKDPTSVKSKWQMSLLKLASGEDAAAANADGQGPTSDRAELLNHAVEATAATGTLLTDPMAGHDDALDAVDKLRDALRNEAGLRIPVVMLCSRVDAFGVYEELPETALAPNRANQAIVYCEVENFSSESYRDGFRSLLASRLELFTRDGNSVWVEEHEDIEDFCRRRRDDFFVAQLVTLPGGLSAGEYVLKVTITDRLASKTNQATKRLTIGRSQGMAAARP